MTHYFTENWMEKWTEGRMAKDDRGAEKAAGDRLKHSRGYERGQKFPAICAIVCMLLCVCAYVHELVNVHV